jgi:hypothetical protein
MAQQTIAAADNTGRSPNTGDGTEFGEKYSSLLTKLQTMFTELYGSSTYTGAKTFAAAVTFLSTAAFAAGATASATQFAPSGDLTTTAGPIGSSATNTTQTLASYTLPANVLDATGRQLEIVAWGRTANNAAPKNVRMAFGGAGFQSGTQTGAAYSWQMTGLVLKATANAQNIRYTGTASGGAITMSAATDTSVDTGTIAIAVTCADASAAQSNIFLDGFTVRYFE